MVLQTEKNEENLVEVDQSWCRQQAHCNSLTSVRLCLTDLFAESSPGRNEYKMQREFRLGRNKAKLEFVQGISGRCSLN